MERRQIYKTLDNVPRVLFWTIDEFLVLSVPVFVGVFAGSVILMCLGFFLRTFYTRAKKNYPRGALLHRLYWRLPQSAFARVGILKKVPGSHYRRFVL